MRNRPDPTQPLPNPRHEAFVQALLRGKPAIQAYASAGYKLHHANAARMRENEGVRARLAELQRITTEKVVDETGISASRVINELSKLGFSNMRNYVRISPEGFACLDLSECKNDHWAAIQEVIIEENAPGSGDGARVVKRMKIKLHTKEAALVSIGKHLGMFGKHTGPAIPLDAAPEPKLPSRERLEEMRKRFAMPQLRSIDGGKQDERHRLRGKRDTE